MTSRETVTMKQLCTLGHAVTRGEFNYVLNPRHPDFAQLRIGRAT